ncbi:MAG: transcriptional repressor LexA [Clostridiales bacterium]|nr:transcriptional repressor LexA [Clostridiales bacterium]
MPGKISKKQEEILNYIKAEIMRKGYPPAVREICEAVHLKSTSSVHAHLETLEKNGYIRRDPTKPRAIEITDGDSGLSRKEMFNIPYVGQVAAGQPIYAEENITDSYPIPKDFLPHEDCFILSIRGESMINIGIMDGDYVIVERKNTANNGDVVVALVDDSATCKTFYKEEGIFRLQPENDDMDPILVDHVEILGKVVAVFRHM